SHALALAVPTCRAYDPAYAFELAVIIEDGIKRMYGDGESCFYYLTVMNEQYEMPAMPEGARDGIIKGLYRFRPAANPTAPAKAQFIGSGAILNEVVKAQGLLERYGVAADVWSATSYNELYREGHAVERWNLRHPSEKARVPHVTRCLAEAPGVVVAASDYLKSQPDMIARWVGRPMITLGTDGFGRSEDRASLRDFFEVDARHVAATTVAALRREGQLDAKVVAQAFLDLEIDPDKPNPATA
ncbi:MAG TPA: pyruvate dehydrogenase (acetyl-transferring), homodimeric type, partial [Vicinamibacterales bacterium]